jgi:hypothetical protein
MFRAATLITFALLAGSSPGAVASTSRSVNYSDAGAWLIGPNVRGRNYSRGMPLTPSPHPRGGWYIDFPQAPGRINSVTFRHGSLAGKKRIVMRYRIEADPGVKIVPASAPEWPAIITLQFQRAGDTWTARGEFETYRWFGTFASQSPLRPGEREMVAPLNGNWTAIQTSSAKSNPAAFQQAIAGADRVGFVFGGGNSYSHGVYATGRARLVVTQFRVE